MIERDAPPARPARRALSLSWAGLIPFFLFSAMFLGLPLAFLAIGSIADNKTGAPTLANYGALTTPSVATAFRNSIEVSLVTGSSDSCSPSRSSSAGYRGSCGAP